MGRRAYGSGCSGEIVGILALGCCGMWEFRTRYAVEYAELDQECSGLTVAEKHLGEYEF